MDGERRTVKHVRIRIKCGCRRTDKKNKTQSKCIRHLSTTSNFRLSTPSLWISGSGFYEEQFRTDRAIMYK